MPKASVAILGARMLEQLDDNLGAADLHLSAEVTTRLEEASTPLMDDYPYGDHGGSQRDRGLPGPCTVKAASLKGGCGYGGSWG